jgi:hypothetical protein
MPDISYKWVIGLGMLGMLFDTLAHHPTSAVENELLRAVSIQPSPNLSGFANERQWLFAHRHFRNRCVLEALAESKRHGENLDVASQESGGEIGPVDRRFASNN